MKNLPLILVILITSIAGCGNPKESTTEKIGFSKTLIVVGDDRSGSTSEIRKLNENDYREIMKIINDLGGGTFAISIIGNPPPDDRQCFRLNIQDQKAKETIITSKNPTYTELGKQNKYENQIDAHNDSIRKTNLENIENFISSTISPKVIGYKAYKNQPLTSIDNSFQHINTLVNETDFKNYDNIVVVLFCDGINEPYTSGKIEKINEKLKLPSNAWLYLIGWKDKSYFEGISKIESIDDGAGLISKLKNLIKP